MPTDARHDFYIGSWLIQPAQLRVRGPEKEARLEPKVMDVLICLADYSGETVTRDRLLETVWAGTVVTDDVLTRSISTLRKVFDDDPRNPQYIETIPKIGYRLITKRRFEHRGDNVPEMRPSLDIEPNLPAVEAAEERSTWSLKAILSGISLIVIAVLWFLRPSPQPVEYHPTPVTTFPGQESAPSLSPEGRQVAFSWAGEEGDNVDIYVKLLDAESILKLSDAPEREYTPAWSPDGARIAFFRWEEPGCGIYVVPALGGGARRLDSCGANIYGDLAWSPDGRWLAFNDKTSSDEAFSIHLLSPETLERRSITTPPTHFWGDHDPAFSPDGSQISFTRSISEGMQDLYVVSVGGGEPRRLTDDGRNVSGSAWTRDGRRVVFSSNRTGRSGLWSIAAGGGAPVWLGIDDQAFFPNTAGDRLAYLQISGQTNIWSLDLDRIESVAPRIASTRWDLHPQWSPDGRRIVFTSNRSGSYEIWIADSSGGNARRLSDFGGPFTCTPRWSPDGRGLVFTGRPDGHADIYTMGIDEAVPRRLTDDVSDEMAGSWSTDGRWIYFSSNRSGAWEVWRMPAGGGEAERVTDRGGFGPQESGAYLYYAKHIESGLWRRPVDGGEESQVLAELSPRDWGNWAVVDQRVFYIHRSRPNRILAYDLSTSRVDTLFTTDYTIPTMDPALSVSADGRWVLFGQSERSEGDIMLVEGFGR